MTQDVWLIAQTDFIHDQVAYPVLFPRDLEAFLALHPDAVLIDVRTPGEFSDTSTHVHLNIGRLKNAVNIPVDSLLLHPEKWEPFFKGPAILYCSHSQRSRRACKALSGKYPFPIYNLNAGMTWMNHASPDEFPGKEKMLEHHLPFQPVYASDLLPLFHTQTDMIILDVRSLAEFQSMDTLEVSNVGRFKNARHAPSAENLIEYDMPGLKKETPVLIYDDDGTTSPTVARQLAGQGFTSVYCLMGGLLAWREHTLEWTDRQQDLLENTPPYHMINARQAARMLQQNEKVIVFDTRTEAEYQNTAVEPWRRIGRIRHAVCIPDVTAKELPADLPSDKEAIVLVYGARDKAFHWSRRLYDAGYHNVHCLTGGLWSMVYTYANIPGYHDIRSLMEMTDGNF